MIREWSVEAFPPLEFGFVSAGNTRIRASSLQTVAILRVGKLRFDTI